MIFIKKFLITNVLKNSIADKLGIKQGDSLISVNSCEIKDVFDYRFQITEQNITILIEDKCGKQRTIKIYKNEYEDIGIEFDTFLMDNPQVCRNNCIFCFIEQLPKGMRSTLYFKDDDIRLSFLHGNYVTLTNCTKDDILRIIKYKMSPINISVHTTNPNLRAVMLNNVNGENINEYLKMLSDAGININCQIVLCKGINDGAELDKTLNDLEFYYPNINSISVVPVGLTKFRAGKYDLQPYDKDSANDVIKQIEKHQIRNLSKYNSRIVFLSDEFFIMAGVNMPCNDYYEEYFQIENGVGITANFMYNFYQSLRRRKTRNLGGRKINVVTGVLAESFMLKACELLKQKYEGLDIKLHVIKNNFFGENITVTGLLTGRDIVKQIKHKTCGDVLLIPDVMLKHDTDLFLDNYSVKMMEEELGLKVVIVRKGAKDFIDKVIKFA